MRCIVGLPRKSGSKGGPNHCIQMATGSWGPALSIQECPAIFSYHDVRRFPMRGVTNVLERRE